MIKEDSIYDIRINVREGAALRTMHTQRSSNLAFLRDNEGTRHVVSYVFSPRSADLVIGTKFSLSVASLIRFAPILGVVSNKEETFIATVSNPALVVRLKDDGEPELFPTNLCETTEMVNIAHLHQDKQRNEMQLFTGTNEGVVFEQVFDPTLTQKELRRNHEAVTLRRVIKLESSINDMAFRWDAFGRCILFVVTDANEMHLFRRHGVKDGEPLSHEHRCGRDFGCHKKLDVPRYVAKEKDRKDGWDAQAFPQQKVTLDQVSCDGPCASAASPQGVEEIPSMVSYFTYCAWSKCGRYAAATADQDHCVVVWEFVDGEGMDDDKMNPIWFFNVDYKPYSIIAVGDDFSSAFCFVSGPELHYFDVQQRSHQHFAVSRDTEQQLIGLCEHPLDLKWEQEVMKDLFGFQPGYTRISTTWEGCTENVKGFLIASPTTRESSLRDFCADWMVEHVRCREQLGHASTMLRPKCPHGNTMFRLCPKELVHDAPSCTPKCSICKSYEVTQGYFGCHHCCYKLCGKCVVEQIAASTKKERSKGPDTKEVELD